VQGGLALDDLQAFWAMAEHCWSDSGLQARLLQEQDARGLDVLWLLFVVWFPGRLTQVQWEQLRAAHQKDGQRQTLRLRCLRRRLRSTGWAEGYRALCALEIQSERHAAMQLLLRARALASGDVADAALAARTLRLTRLFPELPHALLGQLLHALPSEGGPVRRSDVFP
jgi:hypothetical protein